MKKFLLLLLMAAPFFTVAAEYQAEWIEPLSVRKTGHLELTPADPKADVKNLRRTAFYVDCNEYGIMFTIQLDENDAKARNEVELFFAPEGCSSYYQFYGFPFEKNMTSYPYGTYSRLHPRLQRKNWQISYQMTPSGMTLRVLVDWKILPGLSIRKTGKSAFSAAGIIRVSSGRENCMNLPPGARSSFPNSRRIRKKLSQSGS